MRAVGNLVDRRERSLEQLVHLTPIARNDPMRERLPGISSRLNLSRRSFGGGLVVATLAAPSLIRSAFADTPEIIPFRYHAPAEALDDLKQRLRKVRLPDGEITSDWSQGVPAHKLQALIERWANAYEWRTIERKLNTFDQFRTGIDGLNFHFLHVRSPHANALPLIVTHGWPSTVLEFHQIIGPLTDPTKHGGRAEDAFHFVAASLPGFAFSDKPAERGWNMDRTARAWGVLMSRLGYTRYVAQGGDWGAFVTTRLAQQKPPGLAAVHLTMPQVVPDPLPASLTKEEQRAVEQLKSFKEKSYGFYVEQANRPQTIAYSLADSPAGQAAWLYDIYGNVTPDGKASETVPIDDMLNEITLYWLTNSAGSSARFYFEQNALGMKPNLGVVDLPVGCSIFPRDFNAPRVWAEKLFPHLFYWNEPDRGGHFAPLEEPVLFVQELRNCFRSQRVS
jgi:pimeloyl-ACP methyl ester carboxylesterase